MNKILSDSIQAKLDEINNTSEYNIQDKMLLIIHDLLGVDKKNINTMGVYTGEIVVIFQLLKIESGMTDEETQIPEDSVGVFPITDKVEILYFDDKDNCRLNFVPNNDATYKVIFSKEGQNINNFSYQRNLLKLIATIIYMKDRKMKACSYLPEFEENVRKLLDYYAIYPMDIEPFDKLISKR